MNNSKPLRILHVVTKMDAAGIETFIMNIYRKIDREKVQFDFLTHRVEEGFYDEEIKKLGGIIYTVPNINPFHHSHYIKALDSFFCEHEYKIVHSHINTFSMYVLRSAKEQGVPIRIAHSHIASVPLDYKFVFREYCRKRINNYPTHRFACSNQAGKWLFQNQEFEVINNGIDIRNFYYQEYARYLKRKELGITDEFLIGNIGRFTDQKNQLFLLDIFNELSKKDNKYKLLLIGKGKLKEKLIKKILKYGLEKQVIVLQDRDDVSELLNAMDLFLFPSKYEGLGIVAVEAATNGLPVVMSANLPEELNVTENIHRISLKKDISHWANVIEEIKETEIDRRDFNKESLERNYDSQKITNQLQEFYLSQEKLIEGEHI